MNSFLKTLGQFVYKFRHTIVILWIFIVVLGGVFGSKLPDLLTGGGWEGKATDSYEASQVLTGSFNGRTPTSLTLLHRDPNHTVGSEEYASNLKQTIGFLQEQDGIESVYSLLDAPKDSSRSFIGKDEHTTIAFVEMNMNEGFALKVLPDIQKQLTDQASNNKTEATLLGAPALWGEVNTISQDGLNKSHLYTLPIIIIILLLVFRTVVSAITPLIIAVSSILVAFGSLYFIANHLELSVFVKDAATMIGLGVGIDFSLIFVMRFKQELNTQNDMRSALIKTMQTAGHAILFSGITIIGSMMSLFIVDIAAIRSIALGVIVVVMVLVISGLTLMPASLAIIGTKINSVKLPFISNQKSSRLWYNWSHRIMKRPILSLFIGLIVLLTLSVPILDFKTSTPDVRMLPETSTMAKAIHSLEENYGSGFSSPVQIVVKSKNGNILTKENLTKIEELTNELRGLNNVETVSSITTLLPLPPEQIIALIDGGSDQLNPETWSLLDRYISKDKDAMVIDVFSKEFASHSTTRELVSDIRESYTSKISSNNVSVYVGGETARGMDSDKILEDSLLPIIGVTLLLTYIILLITFRSVLLPLKAILMNVFSLGATYGVLLMIFQHGWGASLLGFEKVGFLQNFIPILLLGLLFSLSTDYEVFLLSRVREEYELTNDNTESVASGLEKTAPMISGAAILMISVFASFAFAGVLPMQQLGFGMAVAIAIDATIVRLLIVPAAMELMGKWNWWMPIRNTKTKLHLSKRELSLKKKV
ncbi:MMPL family transporter [Paenibacillus sp. BR2-3]|uniref:MMPL family transporter n=1 Tax=Paenibacillus sp. BR2-3 TaxID=3048494 RepID=UPI00397767BF